MGTFAINYLATFSGRYNLNAQNKYDLIQIFIFSNDKYTNILPKNLLIIN